jgi:hypothetical protein
VESSAEFWQEFAREYGRPGATCRYATELIAFRVKRKRCAISSISNEAVEPDRFKSLLQLMNARSLLRTPSLLLVPTSVLFLFCALFSAQALAQDLNAQVRLLMKSPDVTASGTYQLTTRPEVLNRILSEPLLLAKLWEAYKFSPFYKATLQNGGVHVDDPTGISGDVFLVEQSSNRRVYFGRGNLNHRLVPAFRGKIALVLTTVPKGTSLNARIDVYVRADSRILGLMAWSMGPLLKPRVENRMNINAGNMGAIMKDLTTEPQKATTLLKKEDAAALMKLLPLATTK